MSGQVLLCSSISHACTWKIVFKIQNNELNELSECMLYKIFCFFFKHLKTVKLSLQDIFQKPCFALLALKVTKTFFFLLACLFNQSITVHRLCNKYQQYVQQYQMRFRGLKHRNIVYHSGIRTFLFFFLFTRIRTFQPKIRRTGQVLRLEFYHLSRKALAFPAPEGTMCT